MSFKSLLERIIESVIDRLSIPQMGWADYNDLATVTTPINIVGADPAINLTNDAKGPITNEKYLPEDVTKLWDSANNELYFKDLEIGDVVDVRIDLEVVTSTNNTEIDVSVGLGNSVPFTIEVVPAKDFKQAGTYQVTGTASFFIGSNDVKNNPGTVKFKADKNCTVKVYGWFIKVHKLNN